MEKLLGAASLLGVLILLVMVANHTDHTQPPAKAHSKPAWTCETTAYGYWGALQKGRDDLAGMAWKAGLAPKILFDVRKFNELRQGPFLHPNGKPFTPPRTYSDWEIESSTRAGFPIRKRWEIIFEPGAKNVGGEPCAIVGLAAAE